MTRIKMIKASFAEYIKNCFFHLYFYMVVKNLKLKALSFAFSRIERGLY